MWWQCSDISEIWAWRCLWIKDSTTSLKSWRDQSRFAAFSTREQIEQVLGYCNQIQWLLLVKNCRLTVACRITELRNLRLMNISDRMIVFTGRVANGGRVRMSRGSSRKIDAVDQLVSVLMIICGRSRGGTLLGVEELRYLCVKPFYLAGFRNFTARFAALVRYRHSAKRATLWVTGDARPFRRGDYAAIFAWTGRADGGMLRKIEI